MLCPSCSAENPETFRFCGSCGAPLVEATDAARREERKVVTVLFADLVGFTARAEQLDPEDVRGVLAPYHQHLRQELERFGGTVEKFIGDAVMALFGAPTAHEDDPERAVRAALAIRDWVNEQDDLQLRIAITTGEALVALGARTAEGEGMASGDVVNTAARLQSAAPVNGILVGETTYRATRHVIDYRKADPVEAKGKSEPIPVWEALQARSRLGVDLGRAEAPLVGRERELDALRDALERARSQRQLQLVTLVGVPGIGKSRLVHELFRVIEGEEEFTTWRQGRSLPYGEGVSFWALAEIVKAEAGILESDPPAEVERKLRKAVEEVGADPSEVEWMETRLGSLVGTTGTEDAGASQAESFSAWRRFLESLAHRHPLVLVFEDLHWADDGLLDFVDQLVDWAREAPLLVLCTARPELLERKPGWGGGKANSSTLSLPPLADEETAKLLSALLERAVLPAETQSALLARAAGNPLYAEQYARMLFERGDGEELPLPETVQGIIAARLDGLSEVEKALLQDASVVGKVFWLGAVASVGGVDRFEAEEALRGLERKELVQRARRSSVEDDTEYAFRHLLVRDVAYGQIPRAARAGKHEAAAAWIESLGRSEDQAEMLSHHYVSALDYLGAAGRDASHLREPARNALHDAGERAASLHAWPSAARFYERALELCPPDDPGLPLLRYRCGDAAFNADGSGLDLLEASANELEAAGDLDAAATAALSAARAYWVRGEIDRHVAYLGRASDLVEGRPESPVRVAVLASQAAKRLYDGEFETVLEITTEALPLTERFGRHDIRVRLLELRGFSRSMLGDSDGLDDFAQSIELALQTHAFDQLHSAYNNLLGTQLALGEIQESRQTFESMRENAERHPTDNRRRWVRNADAELYMVEGNWSEASRIVDEALAEAETATPHYSIGPGLQLRAMIRLATGDVIGASEDTAEALDLSRRSADGQLVAPALTYCAFALIDEGRREEAVALAVEGLEFGELFPRVLTDVAIFWCGLVMHDLNLSDEFAALLEQHLQTPWVQAALEVTRGNFRGAADVLEDVGYRTGEAYARLRAARQLVDEGRRAEADAQLGKALAFYRQVGATRYVREGEALLAASA